MSDIRHSQARTWRDMAGARLFAGTSAAARGDALMAVRSQPLSAQGWKILAKAMVLPLRGSG